MRNYFLFLDLVSKHEIEKEILVLVMKHKIEMKWNLALVSKNESSIQISQRNKLYYFKRNIARIAEAALHKLPGKSSLRQLSQQTR